ncbi:MAG: hypothetical protein ACYC9Z_07120 [Casimicrobiaceae bacterium]
MSPALWAAPGLDAPIAWLFYVCVWICTPLLFNLTRASKLDNALGQLSYPVYLSRILVIDVVRRLGSGHAATGVPRATATIQVAG